IDKEIRHGDQVHRPGNAAVSLPVGDDRGNFQRAAFGVDADRYLVASRTKELCQLDRERREAAEVAERLLPIDVDVRAIVDGAEPDKGALAGLQLEVERALVPDEAVVVAHLR